MNTLDLIVLGIVATFGLFAFVRGFVREALSIGSWAAAGFIAVYAFPYAQPVAGKLIGNPMAANIVAGAVLFILPLFILHFITAAVATRVRGSALSALDRTLGFVFGLVKGAAVVCIAFLAATWAVPEKDWPDWARGARTRPLLASGGEALRSMVPGSVRAKSAAEAQRLEQKARDEIADRAVKALMEPRESGKTPAPSASPGYKQGERRDMDRLFQSTQ